MHRRRVVIVGLTALGAALVAAASFWGEPYTVAIVDAGLLAMLAGVVCLVKPLRWLGIRRRRVAAIVLACGLATALFGALLPAHLHRVSQSTTALDAVLPAYQFNEVHATRVHASAERTFAAVKAVTPGEIRLLRTLMAVRSLGQADLPERRPMLATMNDLGYRILVERPDHEIVLGSVSGGSDQAHDHADAPAFAAADGPGYIKVAFNFVVRDVGAGWCEVTTETRVLGTDAGSRREFAAYWRVIYPGSSLLRVTWLAAIRERAERAR
ncbi:MAG TPA: hypothetical protein VGR21_03895 [Cryptosporangiaceae bacterium]|nr:hypothetical protein [Cryptosporangiaceae bacterium]